MADNNWRINGGTDEQFAWIESGEGHNIVCIERLAGTTHDRRRIKFAGPAVTSLPESVIATNATTDDEWQGMIDLIAAAPEMLTVLREINRYLDAPHNYTTEGQRGIVRAVAAVLAKAEPPRKVTKRMLVTVEVEVEAPADTHLDAIKNHALDSVSHTGGTVRGDGVVKFVSKTVTTLGELYEE